MPRSAVGHVVRLLHAVAPGGVDRSLPEGEEDNDAADEHEDGSEDLPHEVGDDVVTELGLWGRGQEGEKLTAEAMAARPAKRRALDCIILLIIESKIEFRVPADVTDVRLKIRLLPDRPVAGD